MAKGNKRWITQKNILGWAEEVVDKVLPLPEARREILAGVMDNIHPKLTRRSKYKCHRLLGTLSSMVSAVEVVEDILSSR